ncbi:hypothetical protein [Rhizobium sp. WW_1]|jgi:hypothetical protein|uniref:hypothetical protein n=1 Tax=Rhizobium sp. WW_1 TaxID=1907375 RepID=UPI000690B4EE|nr:hypothetical protein [Rhizobium sp. WW_1]RKD61565.1 hypothetical protein BJ928_107166 [Rhizobium sp. WW_1]
MALPTTYNTGTATVNANDVAVAGQGTTWQTSGLQAGDMFMAAGLSVPIAAVNSNTSITLSDPWPGASRAAASYRVQFTPDATRVLASTRAVLDALTNGVLYAIAGLQTAADKIAYFTGQGTAALTSFTSYARSLLGAVDATSARTVLQLGTAAVQNIGTSGATVPLLSNGNTWGAGQTFPGVNIDAPAANYRSLTFTTSGSARVQVGVDGNAETGLNVGSNFFVNTFTDAGVYASTAILVNRSTGVTQIDKLNLNNPLAVTQGGTGGNSAAAGRANLGLGTAATFNVGTTGSTVATYSTKGTWNGEQILSQTGRAWHAILTLIADSGSSYANLIYGARADGTAEGAKRWAVQLGNASPETGGNAGADFVVSRYADNGNWLGDAFKINRQTGVASFGGAVQLPSFTVSTLPSAAANPQGIAYVSNGTSNKRLAISDGASWRFPDGAIVS